MSVDNQTKPDTGTQELREAIIKSLDSFGFQGAQRKCMTPKHGEGAFVIEEWDSGTLATFILDDLEALIASKVEEALENHKKVMKLADTYTFEDGTQFVKVKALQSKEGSKTQFT